MQPFILNYALPPNLTYADVGRLMLLRYKILHIKCSFVL